MQENIWYALIYLFEVLACFMFYENIYTRKADKYVLLGAYAFSFAIQFGCSFIAVPCINLVSFIVCNFLLTFICYEAKIKTCVFTTAMLSFFMFICEIIIIYLSALFFGTPTEEYTEDLLVLITQSSLSKLLFFAVIFFASKIIKSRTDRYSADRHLIMLPLLPLMRGMNQIAEKYGILFDTVGHVGDGNVHNNIYAVRNEIPNHYEEMKEEMYQLGLQLGGTITGEHGIGKIRRKNLPLQLDDTQISLMRGIKKLFDPNQILNMDSAIV